MRRSHGWSYEKHQEIAYWLKHVQLLISHHAEYSQKSELLMDTYAIVNVNDIQNIYNNF